MLPTHPAACKLRCRGDRLDTVTSCPFLLLALACVKQDCSLPLASRPTSTCGLKRKKKEELQRKPTRVPT